MSNPCEPKVRALNAQIQTVFFLPLGLSDVIERRYSSYSHHSHTAMVLSS